MEKLTLNDGWKFLLDDPDKADKHNYWDKGHEDTQWRDVTLPHDWSVEHPFSLENSSGTGYLPGGIAWYRLHFTLEEADQGKPIWIIFDGIYKNSQVWCNGYYFGKRPNGYITFMHKMDHILNYGETENVLAIKVTHTDIADSRWFTGSGVYRKISMVVGDPVYIEPQDWFMATLALEGKQAKMSFETTLHNKSDQAAEGILKIVARDGSDCERVLHTEHISLEALDHTDINREILIDDVQLWSAQAPNLYEITTYFEIGGLTYKLYKETVGVRQFAFDPDKGFFVNGEKETLKGICVHHDGGVVGAAMTKELWLRRLVKLKDMGCNALRCSHNPHMPELYELCDVLGFYVIDEAFDEWEGPKNKWSTGHNVYPPLHQGYHEDFPQWHEEDLKSLILRDRNHASIMMWSVGNEIDYPNDPYCHPLFGEMTGNNDANKPLAERIYNPNRPNAERLVAIAKDLCDICHETDSTRPTTMAVAFPELSTLTGLVDVFDVVGYNYKEQFYERDHAAFPHKPFLGSENGHSYEAWKAVVDQDYISGQFLWTGIDFLGEAHGWPIRGSMAGLMTLAGFEKDNYYFRKSLWSDEPYIKLLTAPMEEADHYNGHAPVWDYPEGHMIHVVAYTNQQHAELFLGDESQGIADVDAKRGCMIWQVPYKSSEVRVVAKIEDGLIEDMLTTSKVACQLTAEVWQHEMVSEDGLIQIEVNVCDAEGKRVWHSAPMIHVTTQGDLTLVGLESGDLSDLTAYSCDYRRAYKGQLLIIVRACGHGSITIKGEGVIGTIIEI